MAKWWPKTHLHQGHESQPLGLLAWCCCCATKNQNGYSALNIRAPYICWETCAQTDKSRLGDWDIARFVLITQGWLSGSGSNSQTSWNRVIWEFLFKKIQIEFYHLSTEQISWTIYLVARAMISPVFTSFTVQSRRIVFILSVQNQVSISRRFRLQ
jgi:hypothetical protein